MTGAETYNEFDNASIITTSTTKDNISLGKYTFRKRDLLLGGIAVVALIGVIILAAVLASQASSSDSCDGASNTGGDTAKMVDGDLPYCVTTECLKAAVYQKPIMNKAINPCDDFYTYACGRYPNHHPQSQFMVEVTAENEIRFDNTRELVYLLDSDVENNHIHSYERKLKDFMKSCNNHFDKMDLRGRPLINKIIAPLGGWYVFGTYNNDSFDFHDLLKKIHVNFWTDAFFTLSVKTDQTNWNQKIVELSFGGMRLDFRLYHYQTNPLFARTQNIYRSYMRVIASLLSIDANISPPNDDLIDQFVEDAYEIESAISKILQSVYLLRNNHAPDNLLTLAQIQEHMNHTIDFVDYMKTLFNEWPSRFNANTKIAVSVTGYFDQLGSLIATYQRTEEGKRKLHNYLMWQVIDRYSHDLSWDYIHSKRKLNHLVYNQKDDSSGFLYCFVVAEATFPKAMSAVYVKRHVKEEGKNAAYGMLERIKNILVSGIRNLSWMTESDRDTAVYKIQQSLYKIGFPDNIVDENYMDNYYYHLSILPTDYFTNILNVNDMFRKEMNNLIGRPGSKAEWVYHVFDPVIEYFNPWSELIVTAAMLQNPLFDASGPAYYNFGGIGSRMASNLIHAIDEYGSSFKLDGSHFGFWWSNMTTNHYAKIKECAVNYQRDEVVGPFSNYYGQTVNVNTSRFASFWAPEVLADSSGIRMAYKAYKEREKSIGKEKLPPGFHDFDADHMFFISYAQSYCRNAPDYATLSNLQSGTIPNKNRVNLAMKNVPEFMKTFGCPKPMTSKSQQCLLFGQ